MSVRFLEYMRGRGVTFLVISHGDPRPADAFEVRGAHPHGLDPDDFVRTVVMVTSLGHALMVLPDLEDLDVELARAALRDPEARIAGSTELARSFPDYEPGAVPPQGLFFLAPMYVDPAVARRESVVFRAGSYRMSIAMSTQALFRDDPVVITPIAKVRRTAQVQAPHA
ncbi:MAG: YbaK/EbsC family protein [Actinomycetota bacterium]